MITSYKLIKGTPNDLQERVNNVLEAGFQPFGNPFLSGKRLSKVHSTWYSEPEIIQAVVYDDKKESHENKQSV